MQVGRRQTNHQGRLGPPAGCTTCQHKAVTDTLPGRPSCACLAGGEGICWPRAPCGRLTLLRKLPLLAGGVGPLVRLLARHLLDQVLAHNGPALGLGQQLLV